MSPELRTAKKVGKLASIALAVTVGMVTPAAAVAQTMTAHGGVTVQQPCDPHGGGGGNGGHRDGKCDPSGPARPPVTSTAACADIDAAQFNTSYELRAVLTGGRTYVGIRDVSVANPPVPGFLWTDLSALPGYPANACGVALPENSTETDHAIEIDVVTTNGRVFETTCTEGVSPTAPIHPILTCNGSWTEQHAPTPGATNG